MSGNYGSENALPLSQRFTLLLITHNRPAFLRRALQYYSSYPCTIIVLDSSSQSASAIAADFPSVEYLHLPQYGYKGLQVKLKYGVNRVTTPYMTFAADDDFLLHDSLTQSLTFLEANPDYGMCHGYCLMYLTHANKVSYYRRDKKVCEDYSSELGQERVVEYMGQYIPPFYAVTRTELLRNWHDAVPQELGFEWSEISHVYYLLACAKARILPIPYVVREANYGRSDHGTEVLHMLAFTDPKSVAARESFAELLSTLSTGIVGLDQAQTKQLALQSFAAMTECLMTGRSLTTEPIFTSTWIDPFKGPVRGFGPRQYVELPFYNQPFFDKLTEFEFLLHAMPAGRLQLQQLEGVWLKQEGLLRIHGNDTPETITGRLWQALDCSPFNRRVVKNLAHQLKEQGQDNEADQLFAWVERLDGLSTQDNRLILDKMPSGRLLNWMEARDPDADELETIARHLRAREDSPQFGLLVLNLDNDADKLQITLDSVLEGHYKRFKIVVFTTDEPPVATLASNTLHFVKVSQSNYVDKLNQIARQSSSDWMMLAEAGDEFTASGLLRASLELMAAPECRAVAADEIHRQADGVLVDVFRPGFNLDLLQSLPALMARHWLIRRDVLVEAGGYCADFSNALEFDLLLRLIEQGGLAWLAHLDEPLLISQAPMLEENPHERLALTRHLATRGYKAQVSSAQPGTYQIDYRHAGRPLVSIILHSQDNMPLLERCLASILQRTRYTHYEVLIADNHSQTTETTVWLAGLGQQGDRVRILRSEQRLSVSALTNVACQDARGEYLILLATDSEVVNPNWIESLLNQAQRPEVGIVGAKLVDRNGVLTLAGLILGMNGGVGSAFVGEPKDAKGYLHRLVLEQNYSAVSAACLMVRKALYEAVGGLDEEHFCEAFSDIDLCLKIGQAGYMTVWTPQVEIIHPGALPDSESALAALRAKWSGQFAHDLAYNKNLALTGKGFTLGSPSSVNWAQLLA